MARKYEYIEERENSYKVHIPYIDETGKRRYYSKAFSFEKYGTKVKALEFAKKDRDKKQREIKSDKVIIEKHYTLDEIFNMNLSINQSTLSTKHKHTVIYNKYIKGYFGGDMDFSKIKYNDIQKSLNAMTTVARNDTIGRVVSLWKKMYRIALINNIVKRDESIYIEKPKSETIEIKKPMETTYNDMLDTIDKIYELNINDRDKFLSQCALIIMYYTGMRGAEVCALNKDYIYFDKKMLYVCESVGSTSKEKIAIKKTKTSSSIRYIPIHDELIPVLEQLILQANGNNYLFVRNNDEYMTGDKLSEVCRLATNGEFRPYTLRHQFSTDMLLNNVDIKTIQELMGHTSSTMTVSYARSNDTVKALAIENRKKS